MKKILFLLILIYSYGFSQISPVADYVCSSVSSKFGSTLMSSPCPSTLSGVGYSSGGGISYKYQTKFVPYGENSLQCLEKTLTTTYMNCELKTSPEQPSGDCQAGNIIEDNYGYLTNCETGSIIPNPQNGLPGLCDDLFEKDGVAYTCNPNNNEATPIPDSNGLGLDEDGDVAPNCNDGFSSSSTANMTVGGSGSEQSYSTHSCVPNSTTPTPPDIEEESGVVTTNNPDGSTTVTMPNGTTHTVTPSGQTVTTYPDGTTTTSGGAGSGGSGGSGGSVGSGGANTPNETNTNTDDTPVDTAPVADSCTSSNLTLQEKMMCEMNAGMKKLNSESSTQNSLNNLLKDLNNDTNDSLTAINKNIKSTNDNFAVLNSNTVDTNKNLQALTEKANTQNITLNSINETLKKIDTNTKETSQGITTSITSSTGPSTSDKLGEIFTPDSTAYNDGNYLEGSSNLIDSLFSEFTEFKNNMITQGDTLSSLISSSKDTISQGFELNLTNSDIVTCPKSYLLNLSSVGLTNQNITLDICPVSSKLKPFLYPLFLILMNITLTFFVFKMIGVLI